MSNTAAVQGGGINARTVKIDATTLTGNRSTGQSGGAIFASAARLTNATLTGNTAALGGGAVVFSTTLAMTNTTAVANGSFAISGTASQPGNTTYLAAPPFQRTFTISPAPTPAWRLITLPAVSEDRAIG